MSETLKEYITLQHRAFTQSAETAFVFVGQGVQQVGMGTELFDYSQAAKEVYQVADEVAANSDYSVTDLSFKGPKELLDQTRYSQPAILTFNQAYYEAIKTELGSDFKRPSVVAGFSLGELSAICVAGSINFAEMMKVVESRAEGMQKACDASPGGKMIVTIRVKGEQGLSLGHRIVFADAIRHLVRNEGLYIGSINTDVQIGLGGSEEALQRAEQWLKTYKREGKHEILWRRLAVSGAFHTPAMQSAAVQLDGALDQVTILDPKIPIIANTNGVVINNADAIKAEVLAHLTSPVRWYHSVRVLYKRGIRYMIEPGSKPVVTAMVQRLDQAILPVKGDGGRGITLAHILLPKDEI